MIYVTRLASRIVMAGADLYTVKLLGHHDMKMTER